MSYNFDFQPVCKDNLLSILAKVDRRYGTPMNSHHIVSNLPHIFIARQLIITNQKIVIAPSIDPANTHMIIIGESTYMRQPEITNRIKNLKLTVLATGKCSQGDLENALKFTVQTRLSTGWAQCSDLLIQGYEFLNPTNRASILGVKFNFFYSESSLKMVVKAESSLLPNFSVKELGIPPEVVSGFLNTPDGFILEDHIPNRWVHVLPTMKKGEIVEIRKTLPIGAPFNSYEELKIYWLSLYGYQLPPNESDIYYVQVLFRLISPEPLTYPSCCIRPGGLRPTASHDRLPTNVVRQFVLDTLRQSRQLLSDFELHLIDPRVAGTPVGAANATTSTASQYCDRLTQSQAPPAAATAGVKRSADASRVDANTGYSADGLALRRQDNYCYPGFYRDYETKSQGRNRFYDSYNQGRSCNDTTFIEGRNLEEGSNSQGRNREEGSYSQGRNREEGSNSQGLSRDQDGYGQDRNREDDADSDGPSAAKQPRARQLIDYANEQ